ncbi:metallophosphoesterase family protein [Roseicyclus sp. F158]|uniref:Metallophosphoesterase family protein n=1 Tax=Tropicimonas omnivorans TaxID=3075590 RepID=A0ABU3DCV6_9RHOB|nr:metallophosphoesterase family protein [Roseicyclus sp. F158]MDT0681545.1 metallophosphoesterase family protein [Roseicyclus sp. F158]
MRHLIGRILRRVRRKRQAAVLPFEGGPPAPERDVYAIGDVHGCSRLLEQLLETIDADAKSTAGAPPMLLFLGDYIDRGDSSREVLEIIHRRVRADPENVIALRGNHEQMLLDFLADPEGRGPRWLANGGLQTLASFGVGLGGGAERDAGDAAVRLSETLGEAGLLSWLSDLPLSWRSGNVLAVHAAADPALPAGAQEPRTLLWGHPDFGTSPRPDGIWVLHGHVPVERPAAENGVIPADTGAYFSGQLTAAAISPGGGVRFLTAAAGRQFS